MHHQFQVEGTGCQYCDNIARLVRPVTWRNFLIQPRVLSSNALGAGSFAPSAWRAPLRHNRPLAMASGIGRVERRYTFVQS